MLGYKTSHVINHNNQANNNNYLLVSYILNRSYFSLNNLYLPLSCCQLF